MLGGHLFNLPPDDPVFQLLEGLVYLRGRMLFCVTSEEGKPEVSEGHQLLWVHVAERIRIPLNSNSCVFTPEFEYAIEKNSEGENYDRRQDPEDKEPKQNLIRSQQAQIDQEGMDILEREQCECDAPEKCPEQPLALAHSIEEHHKSHAQTRTRHPRPITETSYLEGSHSDID